MHDLCRTYARRIQRLRTITILIVSTGLLAGCVTVPKPDTCDVEKKNHFENASIVPGATATQLARKLAGVNDYGNHPTGWLVGRLFPLEDNFEITGEVVTDKGCIRHVPEDKDREFYVKLSDDSTRALSAYFNPPSATPQYVLVEMVSSLSPSPVAAVPFKTWGADDEASRVTCAINDAAPHAMTFSGDNSDWSLLGSHDFHYVAVRGALVVDISDFHAGTGDLEIHPAEAIHISGTPLR